MKSLAKNIILTIIFLSFSFPLFANDIYLDILYLDNEKAEQKLVKVNGTPEKIYFEALNEFVNYLATGDTSISKDFIDNYSKKIELLDSYKNYEAQVYESEIDFMLAIIYFSRNNYVKSAIPAYKVYRKNKKLLHDYPNRNLHLKISGLIELVTAIIPVEYGWLLNISGLNGDIDKGFYYLEKYKTLEEEKFGTTILSSVILSIVQGIFFNNYEIANEILVNMDENNQLIVFLKARNYSKLGQNDKAIELLENYINNNGQVKLTFLYYQLGSALLYKIDRSANIYLAKYLNTSKYEIFKRSVCLKLAWYYQIFKNEKRFDNCDEDFYSFKLGFNETDNQATLEMENLDAYNTNLLISRLLFDGGYYSESLKTIQLINAKELATFPQKVEYMYRYARLYHQLKKYDQAIKLYKSTITFGEKIPFYYAAFSALQLGLIYEEMNEHKNAEFFFKYCLSINKYQYKNSIEYKANAGLKRIPQNANLNKIKS